MVALQKHPNQKINDDETMLTTQDIAIINENMPYRFDVVITKHPNNYTICFIVNNREQQLVTWTGREKTFKSFETVLTCLNKYVYNARSYTIHLQELSNRIELVMNTKKT